MLFAAARATPAGLELSLRVRASRPSPRPVPVRVPTPCKRESSGFIIPTTTATPPPFRTN